MSTLADQSRLHAWDDGMAKYRGLSADIEAAKFSDAARPERAESVGRSQLMGKPKKKGSAPREV